MLEHISLPTLGGQTPSTSFEQYNHHHWLFEKVFVKRVKKNHETFFCHFKIMKNFLLILQVKSKLNTAK